jgi:glycosyltransferase involved in cell wall biosynthesis
VPDAPKTRVSLFFPVYRDEQTVERVTLKALNVLAELASEYEVIIVDDGSPDRAGAIADRLEREHAGVRVIHHERNLGYGRALRSGFAAARFEWICFTDGDDEYEVDDLRRLFRLREFYDLVISFRYAKRYST